MLRTKVLHAFLVSAVSLLPTYDTHIILPSITLTRLLAQIPKLLIM